MSNPPQHKFYQTKEFKKLSKAWEKKLKRSGFEDIEQPADFKSGAPDGNLKQWSASFFSAPSRFNPQTYQAKEEYYRMAGQFLHQYEFTNKIERLIWQEHSEGHSPDTITKTLEARGIKAVFGRKVNRANIYKIVNRLVKVMLEGL